MGKGIVRGFLVSAIMTFFLMILLSIIMVIFDFSEGTYNYINKFITIGSLVIGTFIGAKIKGKKGWITGMILGIIFFIFIVLLKSIIIGKISFVGKTFTTLLFYIGISTVSGILGVNI